VRVILFQDRFAELVRMGLKTSTIRKTARCKPGDTLSLRRWTGKAYRSPQEELVCVTCMDVRPIRLTSDSAILDGQELCPDTIATHDGFANWADMRDWFLRVHGLPFEGVFIQW
jgi:hypothetical protein